MSSSERPPHPSSRAAPPGAYEPSTLRMHADQVRALIRALDEPSSGPPDRVEPAVLVRGVVDLADASEPPTLLYRRPLARAVLRIDGLRRDLEDPRTLHGVGDCAPGGLRQTPRIAFTAEAPRDDPSLWQVESGELSVLLAEGGESAHAPTYAEEVFPPAPSLPAGAADDARYVPQRGRRGAAKAACEDRVRGEAWSRLVLRKRALYVFIVGLPVLALSVVAVVRQAAEPKRDARPHVARVSAPAVVRDAPPMVDKLGNAARSSADSTAEVSLPAALQAASRALAERGDEKSTLHQEALRRAVTQLLAGETRESLVALRALAGREPRVPMLGRVVRLLEAQLAACASRGGDACR